MTERVLAGHGVLKGDHAAAWVPVEELREGDVLIQGDNCVRVLLDKEYERMGYVRWNVRRLEGTASVGCWEFKKGGGRLVLRPLS